MTDPSPPHVSLRNYLLRLILVGLTVAGVWYGSEHNAWQIAWLSAICGVAAMMVISRSRSEHPGWRLANVAVGTAVIGVLVLLEVVYYFLDTVLKSVLP